MTNDRNWSLKVEDIPDGVIGVPLITAEDGRSIGSALVTFKDMKWSAVIQLTDEEVKELGIDLVFERVSGNVSGAYMEARPTEDVEILRELRRKLR